jgi:hypothetical protein
MSTYTAVPNFVTNQPKVEIVAKLDDGRKVWCVLTKLEYEAWQEEGGDLEDLFREDNDD